MDKQTTIKIKRIIFNNGAPDFILSIDEWNTQGGYRGLIKDCVINIYDLIRIDGGCMSEEEFNNLPEWEG